MYQEEKFLSSKFDQKIIFRDLRGDEPSVEFAAFVTSFEDKFNPEYTETKIFNRMDKIYNYQGTTRKITFSFKVLSSSLDDAELNLEKISRLIRMQYPSYDSSKNVRQLAKPPLVKVRFLNFIQSISGDSALAAKMNGVSYKPEIEEYGVFDSALDNRIYPKAYTVDVDLDILHEHPLGHEATNKSFEESFPYKRRSDNFADLLFGANSNNGESVDTPPPKDGSDVASQQNKIANEKKLQASGQIPEPQTVPVPGEK